MNYSIEIIQEHHYILITVHGEINRNIAAIINSEAHTKGRHNKIFKYLEDLTDARNVETAVNNFQFAYHDMHQEAFDRHARIALLVDPLDHSHDFIETVSKNAGLIVTLFRDRKEAIEYLLS